MRIVSINTGRNAGDYLARIVRLAARLAELEPDVVLAQEVFASTDGRYDTVRVLADTLGMTAAHAPAREKPRTVAGKAVMSTSGLAVFSRFAVAQSRAVPLPTSDADGGRVMQIATIDAGGRPLRLINLHLSFLDGADGHRMRAAQWDAVEAEVDSADIPTVIAGDFNATPDGPLLRRLLARTRWDFGPDDLATTTPTALGGLLDVGGDTNRVIDYVIAVRPRLRMTARRVALTETDPALGTTVSDHAAVVADVDWA